MKFKQSLLIFLFTIIFVFYCHIAGADVLNIELSRDKVAVGETFNILYTLESASTNVSPSFSALEKDFHIIATNYGNTMKYVNGSVSMQSFWQISLSPRKAGEFYLPEINFGNIKSEPRRILVRETSDTTVNAGPSAPAFVQSKVSTTSPYIQSQVLYTFKLYYRSRLENARIEPPQIKNVLMVELGNSKNYQAFVNGMPYLVVEANFAVFPQKTGELSIPPVRFHAVLFDDNPGMINDPFYMPGPRSIALATKPITLTVKDIPQGYRGTGWLPAKNLTLTEKWSARPGQWQPGNPVTRIITVEAQGVRADQIPDLTLNKIAGVNMYADTPLRSNSTVGETVVSKLEQKITYIPDGSQSFLIPEIKLNWWNTQTNKNVVASLNSANISVHGVVSKVSTTTPMPVMSPQVVSPIKPTERVSVVNSWHLSPWFWVALVLLVIWLSTMYLLLRRKKEPVIEVPAAIMSDEYFAQACERGDAAQAQQFILSWGKAHWHDQALNLEKLRELVSDKNFQQELMHLEQALYAKKPQSWNGNPLLTAYRHTQKNKKNYFSVLAKKKMTKKSSADLLPPLNP